MSSNTEASFLGLPRSVALAGFAAFAVVLVLYVRVWPQAPVVSGDAKQYMEVAADLADGTLDNVHDRTVGFPFLLVATGSAFHPTRMLFVISILMHFVSVWLLAVALARIGLSRRLLLLFGVVMLLPPYIERAGYVLTETLSEFTLALGVAGILLGQLGRGRTWTVIGAISLGLAAWVRPAYEALIPLVVLVVVAFVATTSRASRWKRALPACLALIVLGIGPILGYAQFNRSRFGFFGLSPTLGFALSTRTVSVVERLPDEYRAAREALVRARNLSLTKPGSSHTGILYIFSVRGSLAESLGLDQVSLSSYLVHVNLRLIRMAPLNYLNEVGRSIVSFWGPDATDLANFGSRGVQSVWVLVHFAILSLAALQGLAIGGVLVLRTLAMRLRGARRGQWQTELTMSFGPAFVYALSWSVVAYTMVISCAVANGDSRHRAPADALVWFATLIGWATIMRWVGRRSGSPEKMPGVSAPSVEESGSLRW